MNTDERIIELETRLTFQEDLLDTLNRVVADQQQDLMQLKELCRTLLTQLREQPQASDKHFADDEIPPHY